ncbi:uncharacterized protein LOC128230682 [Mya arenaria]|uniref:uncharacterized protein LOC128230682 n=1 Tax=Mya arenaria TaxID=6604 RepID=UPI0022E357BA|nr:uncharacterized protein LOC128230682 [Mya arenaria]
MTVFDLGCSTNEDCLYTGLECRLTEWGNFCRCPVGYAVRSANDLTCSKVLDSRCTDVHFCGDTEQVNYWRSYHSSHILSSQWEHRPHIGYRCNLEGTCSCGTGFIRSVDGLRCQQLYDVPCTNSSDCQGDQDVHTEGHVCQNGMCACNDMYNAESYWYSTYEDGGYQYSDHYICKPKIGSVHCDSSVYGTTCVQIQGSLLTHCEVGIEENGQCIRVLGHDCELNSEACKLVQNAECNSSYQCSCKNGFIKNDTSDSCFPVLVLNCTEELDCLAHLEDSTCADDSRCSCKQGFVELGAECISQELVDRGCYASVHQLPDMNRRSPNYILGSTETPIRDDLLPEGWYMLGAYMVSSSAHLPAGLSGICGTKYPISLKESLTADDLAVLELGEELQTQAVVADLVAEYIVQEIDVKLRRCSKNYQLFSPSLSVAFSAFCLGTGSNSSVESGDRWAEVVPELFFTREYDSETQEEMSIPHMYFKCYAFDHYYNSYRNDRNCNGCDRYYYYENDALYYSINWYVNGKHCKSFGPYRRYMLEYTDLNDTTIQTECGQTTVGFTIQCSYSWLETPFGQKSAPIFSEIEQTGFHSWAINTVSEGTHMMTNTYWTPLGCRTPSSTTDTTCLVEWELADSSVCPFPAQEDEHTLCGVAVYGLTELGLNQYGSWQNAVNEHILANWDWIGVSSNVETSGLKLLLDYTGYENSNIYKIQFQPTQTNHGIWNGYAIPDVLVEAYNGDIQTLEMIHLFGNENEGATTLSKTSSSGRRIVLPISDTGEFLFLKSNYYLVEVHIKLESSNQNSEVRLCAVTVRNGNEIFTVDLCESVYRKGFLYVDPLEDGILRTAYSFNETNLYTNRYRWWYTETQTLHDSDAIWLLNGVSLTIRRNGKTLEAIFKDSPGRERFIEMDGIGAIMYKQYRFNDGTYRTENGGFVESWRTQYTESLLNPNNHVSYAKTETYYQCRCPLVSEVPKEETITVEHRDTEYSNYYGPVGPVGYYYDEIQHTKKFTGVVKCDVLTECQEDTLGLDRPKSPFAVEIVEQLAVSADDAGLTCTFTTLPERMHKVEWYIGDSSVLDQGMDPAEPSLKIADIFTTSGSVCDLDKEITCSVTIYSSDGSTQQGPTFYSPPLLLSEREKIQGPFADVCVIVGKCYHELDANPSDNAYLCYPYLDFTTWILNLTLTRAPGDICVPGFGHCETIPGEAFCEVDSHVCLCSDTFEEINATCSQIGCVNDTDICREIMYGQCNGDVCVCEPWTELNNVNGHCHAKRTGSECDHTSECDHINGAMCVDRKCSCLDQFKELDFGCVPKVPGDECEPGGDHCMNIDHAFCNIDTHQCSCDDLHQLENGKCVLISCSFTDSVACDGITNAICTNSMCSCLSSAYIDQETGHCKNRELGDNCAKNEHCSGMTGGKCGLVNQTLHCICNEQYKENGNGCSPKEPGDSCILNENHCSLISGQVFCKSETEVCVCADTYADDNGRCVSKACSSSAECSQNAECKNDICACLITADLIPQTGTCELKVHGSQCNADEQCAHIEGAKCDQAMPRVCICDERYATVDGSCVFKEQGKLYLYTTEIIVSQTLDDDQHTALFRCDYSIDYGFHYQVKWFINDNEINATDIVRSTDASVSSVLKDMELHSLSPDAFQFDSKIKCSVTAFNDSGNNELKTVTSSFLTLFEVSTTNLLFNRGRTATFSVIQNVPFGCGSKNRVQCSLQYIVYDPVDSYDCTDATLAVLHSDTCGGRIDGVTVDGRRTIVWTKQVVNITVVVKNNDQYKLKNRFSLTLKTIPTGNAKPFWTGMSTGIEVHVQENAISREPHCYSHVDPHHGTFDNFHFENQNTGEFILVKHTSLPIIVQMVTEPCGQWGPIPTCACAVTMKSGGDVFTLNHCGGHLTKYLSNLDGTLKVYREQSTNYKVVFNTGMIVSIYVMTYGKYVLNIDIYPSPDDFGQVEGLCGNFNGDPTDDLAYRDTGDLWVPTDSSDRVWSWAVYPDTFSFSWELKDRPDDSLLSENNYLQPSLWNPKAKYCVCPDAANGNYDSICTFHSDDSCKTPVVRKGEIISREASEGKRKNRNKRSKTTNNGINKRLQRMRRQWRETFDNVQRMKRSTSLDTSSNMTTEEAVQFCTSAFVDCPTAISTNETEAGLNKTIQECAADVLSTGQSQWVVYHCDATTQNLEMTIEKNETFVDANPEIVFAVRNNSCRSNCSSNGQCKEGVCDCFDGYGTDLCMIALSVAPILDEAGDDGTCDIDDSDCSCLPIVGNGFVENATCKVIQFKADNTGIFSRFDEYTLPCSYLDLNEVCAPVKEAENRRRKRSDGNGTDVTNGFSEMFELSVSNDGSHFSIPSSVVILDTTCQETSVDLMGTTMVTLKIGYCYIDGTCVQENEDNGDICNICSSRNSYFEWTNVCKKDEGATPTDSKVMIVAVSLAVPFAVTLGVIVCVVIYKAFNKKKIAVTMSSDIDLFDEPSNKRFHLREVPVSILGGSDKPLADSRPSDSEDTGVGPSTENHLQNTFNIFPDIAESNRKTAYSMGFYGNDDVAQSLPGSSVDMSDMK